MPRLLQARPPLDEAEHGLVCKLTTSRHAPADWVVHAKVHAKMIARSWDGARARSTPPGKLVPQRDSGALVAEEEQAAGAWTLDTLPEAARAQGMQVARSQVRRILVAEGVRGRRTRQWATSTDPDFAPKARGSSRAPPSPPRGRRSSVSTSSGR